MSDKRITSAIANWRAEVGVPANCEWIDVEGERIAYISQGLGPELVCLHAVGHGGRDFENLADEFSAEHRVVRIDWPGHGRSGQARCAPDAEHYGRLLSVVLQRAGVQRPVLIGNSIGGAAALHYAQRHPVRALVLCNPAGLLRIDRRLRRGCAGMARFFHGGERRAWWYPAAFSAYYRWLVLPMAAAAAQRRRISTAGSEMAPLLRQAWLGFAQPKSDLRELAASLRVPIWYAWARRDRLNTLRANLAAIEATPDQVLSTYDAGHCAFLEQPRIFARDLRHFLERHP